MISRLNEHLCMITVKELALIKGLTNINLYHWDLSHFLKQYFINEGADSVENVVFWISYLQPEIDYT